MREYYEGVLQGEYYEGRTRRGGSTMREYYEGVL